MLCTNHLGVCKHPIVTVLLKQHVILAYEYISSQGDVCDKRCLC